MQQYKVLAFRDFLFEKHFLGICRAIQQFSKQNHGNMGDNRSGLPYALCTKSFWICSLDHYGIDKLGIALQAMVVKQRVVSIFVMSIICNY